MSGTPSLDDGELILEAARGDRAAFESLVNRHARTVWRLAFALLKDPQEAEEVTQDTFLRVWWSLRTWRGEASVRTWIQSICRNLAIDRLRSRRPEVVSLEQLRERPGKEPDPESREVLRIVLEKAMEDLPNGEREAFVLVDVLGFSGQEAARVCGVPATTLRSRLYRAHQKLVNEIMEG